MTQPTLQQQAQELLDRSLLRWKSPLPGGRWHDDVIAFLRRIADAPADPLVTPGPAALDGVQAAVVQGWLVRIASELGLDVSNGVRGSEVLAAIASAPGCTRARE